MHIAIFVVLLIALLFLPQWWAGYTFRRHSGARADIAGTGGELAQHLVNRFGLDVTVERTERGDHYDPEARVVRLSAGNFDGRSLTAVAVAAHEVGHALQHHRGEPLLAWRTRLVRFATIAQKTGAVALVALPLAAAVTRAPASGLVFLGIGLLSMAAAALVHLVTLPVEWDASFGKALPILEQGEYISAEQRPAVQQVLKAAALTYVAASLASLLNLWRWLRVLRR